MRLFTAIELPDAVRQRLCDVGSNLVNGRWGFDSRTDLISFTRFENLHVTVKFLGELEEQAVPHICGALSAAVEDARVGPFSLAVDEFEFFPARGPIRIIAAGVSGDADQLSLLHAAIEDRCEDLGVERGRQPYRPHITLARCRQGLSFSGRRPSKPKARPREAEGFQLTGRRSMGCGCHYPDGKSIESNRAGLHSHSEICSDACVTVVATDVMR